jgi:hypothetical protein
MKLAKLKSDQIKRHMRSKALAVQDHQTTTFKSHHLVVEFLMRKICRVGHQQGNKRWQRREKNADLSSLSCLANAVEWPSGTLCLSPHRAACNSGNILTRCEGAE